MRMAEMLAIEGERTEGVRKDKEVIRVVEKMKKVEIKVLRDN